MKGRIMSDRERTNATYQTVVETTQLLRSSPNLAEDLLPITQTLARTNKHNATAVNAFLAIIQHTNNPKTEDQAAFCYVKNVSMFYGDYGELRNALNTEKNKRSRNPALREHIDAFLAAKKLTIDISPTDSEKKLRAYLTSKHRPATMYRYMLTGYIDNAHRLPAVKSAIAFRKASIDFMPPMHPEQKDAIIGFSIAVNQMTEKRIEYTLHKTFHAITDHDHPLMEMVHKLSDKTIREAMTTAPKPASFSSSPQQQKITPQH